MILSEYVESINKKYKNKDYDNRMSIELYSENIKEINNLNKIISKYRSYYKSIKSRRSHKNN